MQAVTEPKQEQSRKIAISAWIHVLVAVGFFVAFFVAQSLRS